MPGAEFVRVHARLGRQQAQQQRLLRHFQAEDGHRLALPQRHVLGDVQRQRRLPHRRPRRKNDQLGWLQPGRFVVESGVAGGQARDAAAFAENFLEALETVLDEILDADQPGLHAVFGKLENRGLGAVEDHVRIVARRQRLLLNRRRRVNQAAQNRLFLHDARVVLDVRHARQAVGKLREIRDAAGRFEFAAAREVLHQRDRVDGLLLFAELHHALENVPVLRKKEILRAQRARTAALSA